MCSLSETKIANKTFQALNLGRLYHMIALCSRFSSNKTLPSTLPQIHKKDAKMQGLIFSIATLTR